MKLFISAMDFSSDMHAASIIRKIRKKIKVYVYAIGGENLKQVCDFFIKDATKYSTVGFIDVFGVLYRLKQLIETSKYYIKDSDAVIACDSFAFNRYIIKIAKKFSKKVFYYIAPQVWASRTNRVYELKEFTDKVFVIFPFEEDFLRNYGIEAYYVGHPYLEVFKHRILNPHPIRLGLFPGSRRKYIKRHFKLFLEFAELICKKYKADFGFYVRKNSIVPSALIRNEPSNNRNINIALSTSGSITLENGLSGIPSIVAMRVGFLNYIIASSISKINKIAMPNILLNRCIYPELLEKNANIENMFYAFNYVLDRYESINSQLKDLWEVFYSKKIYSIVELISD
ncbi:MAG: hypothetical protein NZ870_03385 [bacterium]|nr:hypothetical protein [bacterium]